MVLERRGYTVLLAEDGGQALETFSKKKEQIAVVVLDLTMPRMFGWEVFRGLREINPKSKVIISNGHDISEETNNIKHMESFSVLPEPFSPIELEQTIRRVLDQGAAI